MSRIGKVPVVIPGGVTVRVDNGSMTVSGKKGKLSRLVPPHVTVSVSGDRAVVAVDSADRANLYGMYRTLLANMVKGVTDGFTKILEIVDIFRAKTIDVGHKSMILQITGTSDKIAAFTRLLEPFGIIEIARTGKVAMLREFAEEPEEQ